MKPWVLAITGASGSIYAKKLLELLYFSGQKVCLIISEPGMRVIRDELGWELRGNPAEIEQQINSYLGYREDYITYFDWRDIGCQLASGSFYTKGMFVVPCSMATLAGIANGLSRNLIERAADVTVKERRPLLLVPRETPLNAIHLRNMLRLAEIGVHIVPPMPAFYFGPRHIEDIVDYFVKRLLSLVDVKSELQKNF